MKLWSALFLLLISTFASAGVEQTVHYSGQAEDFLKLDTINSVTRYRDREVDSTCTREVPYDSYECHNETRYRQECSWQPGRNVCSTQYERVCRDIRRTRRECTTQPGRQTCRMTEPTQICRNGRCRTEPARRICEDGPSRQVCNNVPYTERECNQEPRQVCTQQPGRNVCSDVPYQQNICGTVTRYRSESYACRRTISEPYIVDRKVSADFDVQYKGAVNNADSELSFMLLESGDVVLDVQDHSPVSKLLAVKKNLNIEEKPNKTLTTGDIQVQFFNKDKVLAPVSEGIANVDLTADSVNFSVGTISHPNKIKVFLKIVRDGAFSSAKTLVSETLSADQFTIVERPNKSRIKVDLSQFGVSLESKKYEVTIKLSLDYANDFINLDHGQELYTDGYFELKP